MRQAPQMRAEVAGVIVTRPGVPVVLYRDAQGSPTVVHIQPMLEPGEILLERSGMIPEIIKQADAVKPSNAPTDRERRDTYRDEIVRSVLGACPAISAKEANPSAVQSICRQLVDAENAKAILRANGFGRNSDSISDMVRTLVTGERKKA
jgi:hypothetical protein